MTAREPEAVYACVGHRAGAPAGIAARSVCISGDIDRVLAALAGDKIC